MACGCPYDRGRKNSSSSSNNNNNTTNNNNSHTHTHTHSLSLSQKQKRVPHAIISIYRMHFSVTETCIPGDLSVTSSTLERCNNTTAHNYYLPGRRPASAYDRRIDKTRISVCINCERRRLLCITVKYVIIKCQRGCSVRVSNSFHSDRMERRGHQQPGNTGARPLCLQR